MSRSASVERTTKETDIRAELRIPSSGNIEIATGVPFLDHILTSLSFHGNIGMTIRASGDLDVDPHHLVEDVGLVIGEAFTKIRSEGDAIRRFGYCVVPMDDALSEVAVDVGGRPYLVYRAEYPQPRIGSFDTALIREFLSGLTQRGLMNLHAQCRYGLNSHHMAEALFKALGMALGAAYQRTDGPVRSTKGTL